MVPDIVAAKLRAIKNDKIDKVSNKKKNIDESNIILSER